MMRDQINIRDPFILVEKGKYYLYGSTDPNIWSGKCKGFSAYVSTDLENFAGPFQVFERPADFWAEENFWAPEVHKYRGKYYMFASFRSSEQGRRCQILRAEDPLGPFLPFAPAFTPEGWDCLDATLYVENGIPYAVFCHEWTQIGDGTMELVRLKEDLSGAEGAPVTLFKASDAPWTCLTKFNEQISGYITDGPFLYKLESGKLLMIWSSSTKGNRYAVGMAVSEASVKGPFRHIREPLFFKDGGHACLFKDLNGRLKMSLHKPNIVGKERPCFFEMKESAEKLELL